MKDLFSIMLVPTIIALITCGIIGIGYGTYSYFPFKITYWFEESHLVCKEVKAAGFGAKVEKTCYILEAIKQK